MTLDGDWLLKMATPYGTQELLVTFVQSGDDWTGSFVNQLGTVPLEQVSLINAQAHFSGSVKTPFGSVKLEFRGTVETPTTMSGQVKTILGNQDFSGERQ